MTTSREEDYLEAILHIVDKKGYAKVGDISRHLHCSAATVTEMFGRLSEKGYVNYEKYGGVTLTGEADRDRDRPAPPHHQRVPGDPRDG
jgi:DtxR family Mn-dependent transcriptional regulator